MLTNKVNFSSLLNNKYNKQPWELKEIKKCPMPPISNASFSRLESMDNVLDYTLCILNFPYFKHVQCNKQGRVVKDQILSGKKSTLIKCCLN